MTKIKYKDVLEKQKRNIMVYAVLCAIFFVLIGAYGYFRWVDYSLYKEAISKNESLIQSLKAQSLSEKSEYTDQKETFDELSEKVDTALKDVFPLKDNYTELTRAFDHFESQISRTNNPFIISNIEYQDIQVGGNGSYKFLPVRMTISSSEENFTKFLQYMEQSGSLIEKVRLMDIQSINMSFSEDNSSNSVINFSVRINAYFQNI